jgi:hypothetical protein
MARLLLKLNALTPNYYSETLQLGAALNILLEDKFSMLHSLSSSGAPHQQLLDVAHTALFLGSYTLQEYSDDGFHKH